MANKMTFTLWDVEHGLAVWITTPSGHHHCIDAGHNSETSFCPFKHMKNYHGVDNVDYLIISHPDKDHIEGLPSLLDNIGKPRILLRNKTLPDEMKYGNDDASQYLIDYKHLDTTYTTTVPDAELPSNKTYNGGVTITTKMNTFEENMKCNDTSIVAIYEYGGFAFIMPGDIEPTGWKKLHEKNENEILHALAGNKKILVAPHHGRPSAYNADMINFIQPHLVLVSDKYGKHETAQEYYSCASGITIGGEVKKILSTKTQGRIKFEVQEDGCYSVFFGG